MTVEEAKELIDSVDKAFNRTEMPPMVMITTEQFSDIHTLLAESIAEKDKYKQALEDINHVADDNSLVKQIAEKALKEK